MKFLFLLIIAVLFSDFSVAELSIKNIFYPIPFDPAEIKKDRELQMKSPFFTRADLEKIISDPKNKKVIDVLNDSRFPETLRNNPFLVLKPRSKKLGQSRLITTSPDARFSLIITKDPKHRMGQTIEVIEQYESNKPKFFSYDLRQKNDNFTITPAVPNPSRCFDCHTGSKSADEGLALRRNWDSYDKWTGMAKQMDDRRLNRIQRENLPVPARFRLSEEAASKFKFDLYIQELYSKHSNSEWLKNGRRTLTEEEKNRAMDQAIEDYKKRGLLLPHEEKVAIERVLESVDKTNFGPFESALIRRYIFNNQVFPKDFVWKGSKREAFESQGPADFITNAALGILYFRLNMERISSELIENKDYPLMKYIFAALYSDCREMLLSLDLKDLGLPGITFSDLFDSLRKGKLKSKLDANIDHGFNVYERDNSENFHGDFEGIEALAMLDFLFDINIIDRGKRASNWSTRISSNSEGNQFGSGLPFANDMLFGPTLVSFDKELQTFGLKWTDPNDGEEVTYPKCETLQAKIKESFVILRKKKALDSAELWSHLGSLNSKKQPPSPSFFERISGVKKNNSSGHR